MDISHYKKYEPFFGSWHIEKLLGEGSFGKVFEIKREDYGETYKAALKIITVPQNESEVKSVIDNGLDDASVTEYFEGIVKEIVSEFVLMSKLKGNSHVVSYEDHQIIQHEGKLGWDILIRMELLTPLMDYAQDAGLRHNDVIKLGIDICHALELCQKRNIIHRDIKPENIFVSGDGNFKLGDFGIARTIEKSSSGLSKKGTYTYMAPEVYKGEEYGSVVDIYSLGIVMYKLLNENRMPFLPPFPEKITHSDIDAALMRRVGGERIPVPAGADGRLTEIVLKACAYTPVERYSSPIQMRTELEAIAYGTKESAEIYPKGDRVIIIPKEHEPSTDDAEEEPTPEPKGTVGIFGKPPPQAPPDAPKKKFCMKCGRELFVDAKLCEDCEKAEKELSGQPRGPIQPAPHGKSHQTQPASIGVLLSEYLNMWKNYVNFSDRTTVRGYWMAFVFNFAAAFVLAYVPYVGWLYYAAVLLPSIAIGVRRLRDAGKHWGNIFWNFLPVVGTIVYIVFLCKPSVADDGVPVV